VPVFACVLQHVALSAALSGSSPGYYGPHEPWPRPRARCGPAFARPLWPRLRAPIMASSSRAHHGLIFARPSWSRLHAFVTPFS
jgi:hypothetical protein